jgi:ATP/maltotriose-dependent transcriptional regulator MalT
MSSSPVATEHPRFAAGFQALGDAEWPAACAHFRAGLADHPECAEAWEGLAAAAYWVPDEDTIFEARERAYHLYRERGDKAPAARMAGWLAVDSLEMRGQEALANGWIQRAQRLLERQEKSYDSAWFTMHHARLLQMLGADCSQVCRLAARAASVARSLGIPEVEALSLTIEGHARLSMGDIPRAVKRMDEASAIVLGGEARDLTAVGLTLCSLMGACERTRDFDRAREWCAVAKRFSEDCGFPIVLSVCRPHYGAVLMWRGQWPEAEEHLEIGRRELSEFVPEFAVGAIALLGALRWRQGRWEEAEQILEPIKHEPPAQVAYAELLAGRGELEPAIDLLEAYLRTVTDTLERAPALELLVRCVAASGESKQAASHMKDLRDIADSVGTVSLRAAAAFAEGSMAKAEENFEAAQGCLGEAVNLFERAGAPFESARARTVLAEVMRKRGRLSSAAREAAAAHDTLSRMGAEKETQRALLLIDELAAQSTTTEQTPPNGLTSREHEILELIALGRSNQEIAGSLVLSVRTVERHISNIYEKLGLEGRTARTAAAAYLHQQTSAGTR